MALCGVAASYWQPLLARVGVGEAGINPPSHSMIADLYLVDRRSTAIAIFALGPCLGILLGFLVGGWLGQILGWRCSPKRAWRGDGTRGRAAATSGNGGNGMREFLRVVALGTGLAWVGAASAQQIMGTPGSPSATITINGEQIPAPPQKLGGRIADTVPQSKPY